ncbi:cupin domain-containing protein [Rhizorhabdus wittichii]|uniref:Cupin domain-containing protein n=1 Tax=Rhizorhabdus wittichii TaxID=160791 RepID=A0A975HDN9_9SPHN|nr:cupin domain-containing protein [Rhizorhabdus wittichii]QTH21522.1 cupin domain-containing protein [Rhizorhabdus wittichii]
MSAGASLPPALPPVRRVVTANDAGGRSFIREDGENPAVHTVAGRPGFRSANIWRTIDSPTPIDAEDTITEHEGVQPPPLGTVFRIIDFPPRPEDPEERRRQASASLNTLFADAHHEARHDKPGMHVTASIDYAIVLSGTITAIMDDGETDLHAGDVLIQRGTNHGWENRTRAMARVAFILIDGRPE